MKLQGLTEHRKALQTNGSKPLVGLTPEGLGFLQQKRKGGGQRGGWSVQWQREPCGLTQTPEGGLEGGVRRGERRAGRGRAGDAGSCASGGVGERALGL